MKNFTLSLFLTFFVLGCMSSSEILQAENNVNDSQEEKFVGLKK